MDRCIAITIGLGGHVLCLMIIGGTLFELTGAVRLGYRVSLDICGVSS